mgnify:CR=1 FL=1
MAQYYRRVEGLIMTAAERSFREMTEFFQEIGAADLPHMGKPISLMESASTTI